MIWHWNGLHMNNKSQIYLGCDDTFVVSANESQVKDFTVFCFDLKVWLK